MNMRGLTEYFLPLIYDVMTIHFISIATGSEGLFLLTSYVVIDYEFE